MLTTGEAVVLESKALVCLRQGDANPAVRETAKRFARRAAKFLHKHGRYHEASNIAKKLLDNNAN